MCRARAPPLRRSLDNSRHEDPLKAYSHPPVIGQPTQTQATRETPAVRDLPWMTITDTLGRVDGVGLGVRPMERPQRGGLAAADAAQGVLYPEALGGDAGDEPAHGSALDDDVDRLAVTGLLDRAGERPRVSPPRRHRSDKARLSLVSTVSDRRRSSRIRPCADLARQAGRLGCGE